jgi:NTE family protein
VNRDPRVGLVLGGGGAVGVAYHAGALTALENDVGWDPRSAAVIVGTSAGSLVGALLRRGVAAIDLAALTVGASVPEDLLALAGAMADRAPLPAWSPFALLRFRPPRLPVVAAWLRRPWQLDPVLALTSLLPDGRIDLLAHVGDSSGILDGPWPDDPLWVCAVRQRDLRRAVFGRDRQAELPDAVAASCAIPGYFRPAAIAGETYLDGGVRSPTNADVLRTSGIDLAIVVSPMSGQDLPRLHPASTVRRYAKAKVDHEVRMLREHGIPTVLIEPGNVTAQVLGSDPMREDHLGAVVSAALLDTGDQLREPVARLLMHAVGRPRRQVAG